MCIGVIKYQVDPGHRGLGGVALAFVGTHRAEDDRCVATPAQRGMRDCVARPGEPSHLLPGGGRDRQRPASEERPGGGKELRRPVLPICLPLQTGSTCGVAPDPGRDDQQRDGGYDGGSAGTDQGASGEHQHGDRDDDDADGAPVVVVVRPVFRARAPCRGAMSSHGRALPLTTVRPGPAPWVVAVPEMRAARCTLRRTGRSPGRWSAPPPAAGVPSAAARVG